MELHGVTGSFSTEGFTTKAQKALRGTEDIKGLLSGAYCLSVLVLTLGFYH